MIVSLILLVVYSVFLLTTVVKESAELNSATEHEHAMSNLGSFYPAIYTAWTWKKGFNITPKNIYPAFPIFLSLLKGSTHFDATYLWESS